MFWHQIIYINFMEMLPFINSPDDRKLFAENFEEYRDITVMSSQPWKPVQ